MWLKFEIEAFLFVTFALLEIGFSSLYYLVYSKLPSKGLIVNKNAIIV